MSVNQCGSCSQHETVDSQKKKIDELKSEVEKMELILENNLLCRKNDKKKIDELEAANARLFSDNAELEAKLAKAVKALRFYADHNNWFDENAHSNMYFQTIKNEDDFVYGNVGQVWAGEIARKTLAEIEKGV